MAKSNKRRTTAQRAMETLMTVRKEAIKLWNNDPDGRNRVPGGPYDQKVDQYDDARREWNNARVRH